MSTSSQNGTTFPFISAKDWKFTFWRKCTRQVSDWRTGRTAEGELKSKEWKAGGLTEGFKYWRVRAPRPLCCHDISTPDSQAYASPKMWGGKLCYSLDTLIVSMKRPQMYWHFRDPTWSLYDFASLKVTFLFTLSDWSQLFCASFLEMKIRPSTSKHLKTAFNVKDGRD